jgi:DNA uptake protein ComE-like DNA-binding protein
MRHDGYIFTYLEELSELVGIPEKHIQRIAPLIMFTYDYTKEASFSWRKLNTMTLEELIAAGVEAQAAARIIQERDKNGSYRFLIDVKRRTRLPLSYYNHLF